VAVRILRRGRSPHRYSPNILRKRLSQSLSHGEDDILLSRVYSSTRFRIIPFCSPKVLYRSSRTVPIPKEFQNLVFDKASAPDLQQAQPPRKQAMCKHMVDGRGCKGGDASAVKNQILKFLGYILQLLNSLKKVKGNSLIVIL